MPTARVQMTIEVEAGSTWTKDTTMEQIYKQASTETVAWINGVLTANLGKSFRFIDKPKVIAVFNTMEEKP